MCQKLQLQELFSNITKLSLLSHCLFLLKVSYLCSSSAESVRKPVKYCERLSLLSEQLTSTPALQVGESDGQ